jgi:DNA repair protein RadC
MNMNVIASSNVELLAILVGKTKALKLAQKPLSEVFGIRKSVSTEVISEPLPSYDIDQKLAAAKELVTRCLSEQMTFASSFKSPAMVKDYMRLKIAPLEHEVFCALFLDTQHCVIAVEELFRGTLSQASVYPREVVKRALFHNAAAVILAHNHPSGVAEPSMADQSLTGALKSALALVDVRVLDHFVVTADQVLSFAERGLL